MPTSGTTTFTSTRRDIIKDALTVINVTGTAEPVSAEDGELAANLLNRMIKAWQTEGLHLWKKKTGTIFLQKNQYSYDINRFGDNATESYVETTLSADEDVGQTVLSVTSSAGMTIADFIGIENEENYLEWFVINDVPSATTVEINAPLTVKALLGAKVYAYTTKIDEPFNVYSAVRESESQIDIPMEMMSYEEYFQLPNKRSSGVPVNFNYDRQLGTAIIRIWPVPTNVKTLLKITYAAKIQDFTSPQDTPDFPQEWEEAIVYNLAVRLAHAFGKADIPSYGIIQQRAYDSLMMAMTFDSEQGSWHLQPDFYGEGYA